MAYGLKACSCHPVRLLFMKSYCVSPDDIALRLKGDISQNFKGKHIIWVYGAQK